MFGECNTPRKLEILTPYVDLKLEAQWAEPVSLTFHSALRKLNTEPSHQIWFFWLSSFREKFLRNRPIRNKHCLWRPCLSTDQN